MNRKAIDVDPYDCEECGAKGRVLEKRKGPGYVRRRHQCACGFRWTSYHSRLNPHPTLKKLARLARRARHVAAAPEPSQEPTPAPPRPLPPPAHPPAQRRVARSSYLGR